MFATKSYTDTLQLRELQAEIEVLERKRISLRKRLLRTMEYQQEHGIQPGDLRITEQYIRDRVGELRVQILGLHEKYQQLYEKLV